MSEKWTAGPWSIIYDACDQNTRVYKGVGDGPLIGRLANRGKYETAANARLIAAAPDLVEALEIADRRIAELCEMICTLAGNPRKARAADYSEEVRAALAAARGKG